MNDEDCNCGCGGCDDTYEAKDANDPCQEGYEQYGMKTKNGRKVPNCVPIAEANMLKEKYGSIPMDEEVEAYMKRNYMSEKVECPQCEGTGKIGNAICEHCAGKGYHEKEEAGWDKEKKAEIEYEDWGEDDDYFVSAADNENKPLNKPFRTPKGPKKFSVYVRNDKGNVVKVNFGDPNMEIKRDDPARRKSFRSRHNCQSPGPKYKARYWSCKMWSKTPVNKLTQEATAGETCCAYCGCCSMSVTTSLTVEEIGMKVQASTGKSIVEIKGIAFHEGINKNGWEISKRKAMEMVEEMKGVDVTLNHPKPAKIGFSRNMDGGINEATVGEITEASFEEVEGGWNVRYKANIHREELFESLESGLWTMKKDYGVSIGGYGVPDRVDAEKKYALFDSDFKLDHLAVVYKPAYERANIEEVSRIEPDDEKAGWDKKEEANMPKEEETATASFIYPKSHGNGNEGQANTMTDEETIDYKAELEAMKAELVLANATVEQFKNAEAEKLEAHRQTLVKRASEIGLKGHEELGAEVIESLIASWESANPPQEEVVMEEATPAVASSQSPTSEVVVANYLNGKLVKTDESLYARCWNAWASAWNKGRIEGDAAPMFEELSNPDWIKRA